MIVGKNPGKLNLTELKPYGGNQNCYSTIKQKELSDVEGIMLNCVNERQSLEYSEWNRGSTRRGKYKCLKKIHGKERLHHRDHCASYIYIYIYKPVIIISTGRPRGSESCLEVARGAFSTYNYVKQTAALSKALRLEAKGR